MNEDVKGGVSAWEDNGKETCLGVDSAFSAYCLRPSFFPFFAKHMFTQNWEKLLFIYYISQNPPASLGVVVPQTKTFPISGLEGTPDTLLANQSMMVLGFWEL